MRYCPFKVDRASYICFPYVTLFRFLNALAFRRTRQDECRDTSKLLDLTYYCSASSSHNFHLKCDTMDPAAAKQSSLAQQLKCQFRTPVYSDWS